MEHLTNGDHFRNMFRNMSDTDIMKWMMVNLEINKICNFCIPTMKTENKCDGCCISGVLKWLQQPVDNS